MGWSKQQLQAITARRQNVLVAAAAGSGKTSVLVERIIQRITDPVDPLDVDRLLVVTFTNAAAAEMRARIGAAITEALKGENRSRRLERQLVLLNSASISTIHAFCQNVVRQNFHLLDIDPKFRVAGDAECVLMKNDVLEELFEERYSSGDKAFLDLVDHYGDERSDEPLYSLVLGLYNFSRSHPWPNHWLNNLEAAFALAPEVLIDDTPWSQLIREKVVLELEQACQSLDWLAQEALLPGNPEAYAEVFAADRIYIEEVITAAEASWSKLETALSSPGFIKLPSVKGIDDTIKKHFQNARQKVKDKIKKFKTGYFDRSAAELLNDMRQVAPLVGTLAKLTIDFGERYAKAKQEKSLVDFNDLEHFCLAALSDQSAKPGEIKPSPAAKALQEKYAEIMIDEYQDTNGVQETILRLIASPEDPNLFMVGDVKQSIYRFRLAEPELFIEKYINYPTEEGEKARRIDLAQNFRSRAVVLHGVNFLFEQLMSPRVAELSYKEAEMLNPGPDYPHCEQVSVAGPVELCLIDCDNEECTEDPDDGSSTGADAEEEEGDNGTELLEDDLSGFELEARLIAKRLIQLKEENRYVYDKTNKGYRALAWRDVVILLRSTKGKAAVLLEVLRQIGIPAYAEVDNGYFREIEVQVMLSLLSIIDNPRQDIHLAGVLRSPIVGMTAAQLAEARLCRPAGDLWRAVTEYASTQSGSADSNLQSKLQRFIVQLDNWRALSRRNGVPELIWQIYRNTGYYDYVGGIPGGTLRQANLRALYDRARQYETTNFRGLFRFLRFIDQMQDKGSDLAVARALGESEDVVRIMSIHKSKGLEFPVVFVADLGKNFNLQDSRGLVLCHKVLGVGPYVTNPELRYRYPTIARHAIAYKLDMETKAEELRILYVALTRAREKLILVGSAAKLAKRAAAWCQTVGRINPLLPDSLISGAKSYLDWLCPAVIRHQAGENLRKFAECVEARAGTFRDHPSEWLVNIYKREELLPNEDTSIEERPVLNLVRDFKPVELGEGSNWVEQQLGWQYCCSAAVGKPAKLSVTEIKRRFDTIDSETGHHPFEKKTLITRPRFAQVDGKLTAAEYGTLMHSVMQHVNLAGDISESGLAAQVADMVKRDLLLPEQAAAVNIASAAAFFSSPLGQRMIQSHKVRRELPFSITMPAERFYSELSGASEGVFVQGVIDVLFDDPSGLVLVDYKTDNVKNSSELAERYAVQLNLYAEAIEKIFKRPVAEKHLYIFSTGESVQL